MSTKTCPHCGAVLADNARFCIDCMTVLNHKRVIPPPQYTFTRWLQLTAAVLVLLLLVSGIGFWGYSRLPVSDVLTELPTTDTAEPSGTPPLPSTESEPLSTESGWAETPSNGTTTPDGGYTDADGEEPGNTTTAQPDYPLPQSTAGTHKPSGATAGNTDPVQPGHTLSQSTAGTHKPSGATADGGTVDITHTGSTVTTGKSQVSTTTTAGGANNTKTTPTTKNGAAPTTQSTGKATENKTNASTSRHLVYPTAVVTTTVTDSGNGRYTTRYTSTTRTPSPSTVSTSPTRPTETDTPPATTTTTTRAATTTTTKATTTKTTTKATTAAPEGSYWLTATPGNTTEDGLPIEEITWYYKAAESTVKNACVSYGVYPACSVCNYNYCTKTVSGIPVNEGVIVIGFDRPTSNGIYRVPAVIDGKPVVAVSRGYETKGCWFNDTDIAPTVKRLYLPPECISFGSYNTSASLRKCNNMERLYFTTTGTKYLCPGTLPKVTATIANQWTGCAQYLLYLYMRSSSPSNVSSPYSLYQLENGMDQNCVYNAFREIIYDDVVRAVYGGGV